MKTVLKNPDQLTMGFGINSRESKNVVKMW